VSGDAYTKEQTPREGRTWNATCKHCTNSAPQSENSLPPHYSSSAIPCLHWARGTASFALNVCFQCVDREDAHMLSQTCARSSYHVVKEAYPPGIPFLPVQLVLVICRGHFYCPYLCCRVLAVPSDRPLVLERLVHTTLRQPYCEFFFP